MERQVVDAAFSEVAWFEAGDVAGTAFTQFATEGAGVFGV
jgi:hypothetical protein